MITRAMDGLHKEKLQVSSRGGWLKDKESIKEDIETGVGSTVPLDDNYRYLERPGEAWTRL